ncbi:protocatechuate 3,4-dioxygenase subunit alpha [Actinoplanes sp. N902-109]|uniref:protocatechuate 3,4-dioxygenase subunit alpha n=1 Tax=Actinoplanes sp. (strain N902-109) TaxID=649831 RepID=UPI0003293AE2|nr:protocatechuate 3,4-dioxygenase subunit alpha [Actinoplanes sp. N902-109]AGL16599.1 protocatechuate 3,4-dioxygenase, alpha subunit [Actinoplanes sp. N902-109]
MRAAPGQTVGPFFHLGLPYDGGNELVPPGRAGAIRLHGRVLDGDGVPVPDAMLELWQAGPDGTVVQQPGSLRRDGWTFTGFGRTATTVDGHYSFTTVEPGPTGPGRPAFFAFTVFARGLLDRLFTRAYLPGADEAGTDPLLAALPPERRTTLLTTRDATGLAFDVHLQGPHETVFLSFPRRRGIGT